MRKTFRLTRVVGVGVMVAAIGMLGVRTVAAAESAATDCLIGLEDADGNVVTSVTCKDGEACDADGQTNHTCTIRLKACLNIPAAGCPAGPIKNAKVKPKKAGITVTPNGSSSVCGAFADFVVKLKKKGHNFKDGKKTLTATVKTSDHPAKKDKDKISVTCQVCTDPNGCVTTTTTSTTTTTTIVAGVPVCGDGTKNGNEECDATAAVSGCGGGQTCMPPGAISECTCKTCTAINPVQTMQFTTSNQTTSFCGDPGLISPGPSAPFSGSVTTDANETINLGAGCLYIGGGGGSVPGGIIPDGSQSKFDLTMSCGGETIVAPQAGASTTCTKGSGPGKACINDLTSWPNLQACTTDDDCPKTGPGNPATTAQGSCVDKPNCLFGPPLPIENGPLSTCVVNTIGVDASGSLMPSTGQAQVTLPLRSHTFIRPPNDTTPCPVCTGNPAQCSTGARVGMACSTSSPTAGTTIDCPPSADGGAYLPEFQVTLEKLTTGTSTKSDSGGLFCPNQKTFSAFGTQNRGFRPDGDPVNPPIKIVTITANGSPAGDVTDNQPHASTLAAVFCIPETGNGLIDGAADLAGPGMVTLVGNVQILP